MIRARIPIHRHENGLWQVGQATVQLTPEHQISVSPARPDASLEDLVDTMMGEALYSLEKSGRRGTSDPIEWEILVNDVLHCYRCVQPMVRIDRPEGQQWECPDCHTSLRRE